MSEFTELCGDMCIFSCLVFRSHEYSVAYEILQPSRPTDAYKRVAYKKICVFSFNKTITKIFQNEKQR